jgi:hypothetical protein
MKLHGWYLREITVHALSPKCDFDFLKPALSLSQMSLLFSSQQPTMVYQAIISFISKVTQSGSIIYLRKYVQFLHTNSLLCFHHDGYLMFLGSKQEHSNHTLSESESRYDQRSVGESVLVSSPILGSRPDINYCLTVPVLSMLGAPSDERSGLSFVLITWTASVQFSKFAAGLRQLLILTQHRSHRNPEILFCLYALGLYTVNFLTITGILLRSYTWSLVWDCSYISSNCIYNSMVKVST